MSTALALTLMGTTIVLVMGGYACGDAGTGPTPTVAPPATPTPIDPGTVLRESGKVMEELASFHFHLGHRSGRTPLTASLAVKEVQGDVVKPDKMSVRFTGTFGGFAINSKVINIGDTTHMTNPLTGQWETMDKAVSPLGFFDPRRGIASMMSRVDEASLLSAAGETIRLGGRLPAEALARLVGTTVTGTTVTVELAIDARNLYLIEVLLDGRITPTEPDGTVRVITLSRFGEPVAIEPPQ